MPFPTRNWSAVASQAFEGKLLELQSVKESGNMDELVESYIAAAEIQSKEQYQKGHKAGESWARDTRLAGPRRLGLLHQLESEPEWDVEHCINNLWLNGMNKGVAWGLYAELHPGDRLERSDRPYVEAFWESVLGDCWEKPHRGSRLRHRFLPWRPRRVGQDSLAPQGERQAVDPFPRPAPP